jgi:Arc/MetJ-type ribon-helix-helix transcriptional regulator
MKRSSTSIDVRSRTGETEKMTVNVGVVDLGHVDLLVQEGFYSNRSDLMRTALRNQLALHADTVKQTVARRTLTVGLQHCSRADLESGGGCRPANPGFRLSDLPELPTT